MKPKNDVMTLIFLIIGLLAAADLVFVQLRQQANEDNAREKLGCVVEVVEAARANVAYNNQRDLALRAFVESGNGAELKVVLSTPPPPFPQCEINWDE
jgi:hypothetical protein